MNNFLILTIPALVIVALAYILYVFPWITGYLHLFVKSFEINGSPKILFFSDTHLNSHKKNLEPLARFLLTQKPEYVIIAGDLLDNRKRMNLDEFSILLKDALTRIGVFQLSDIEIFYVTSLSSHDPIINRAYLSITIDKLKVHVIQGALLFKTSSYQFFVLHGDYFSRNGAIAGLINVIMKKAFGKSLWSECFLKKKLNLPINTWLIMGHTHSPGIDNKCKVANTGSWSSHIGRYLSNTVIFVDEQQNIRLLFLQ
ncbi:MAG: hypothetical protein ACP6IS_06760 [Candidatus Asgardarchaeia archaeon]